jgi:putative addiction module component (TIGR02574 family)
MSVRIDTLGIDRLSVREKLDLIEEIWDSLPEMIQSDEVPDWHLSEVLKRREEVDANPPGSPMARGAGRSGVTKSHLLSIPLNISAC